jgi:hypothetical protein
VQELDFADWDVQCLSLAEAEAVLEKLVLAEEDHCLSLLEGGKVT